MWRSNGRTSLLVRHAPFSRNPLLIVTHRFGRLTHGKRRAIRYPCHGHPPSSFPLLYGQRLKQRDRLPVSRICAPAEEKYINADPSTIPPRWLRFDTQLPNTGCRLIKSLRLFCSCCRSGELYHNKSQSRLVFLFNASFFDVVCVSSTDTSRLR